MTVAIIGTGKMGGNLARLLASRGIQVAICARDPAKASALAHEIGGTAQGGGIAAAVQLADIVVLAVWYQHFEEAVRAAGDLTGKILIDISNPLTEDFKGLRLGYTTSAAEELQALAPQAKVVKAFNTIFGDLLPADARVSRSAPVQVFVAGDDEAAKKAVSEVVLKTGFEPIESGPLTNARLLEPMGVMNVWQGVFLGMGTNAAPAWSKAA
jgi:predicted dinucleotide-binding enzyme